jgi:hypothetical protein
VERVVARGVFCLGVQSAALAGGHAGGRGQEDSDRVLRWLLRGVRPGNVRNPELRGSAGLTRGFGRCAQVLLGEVCAALDSAMLMTSQWAAKS